MYFYFFKKRVLSSYSVTRPDELVCPRPHAAAAAACAVGPRAQDLDSGLESVLEMFPQYRGEAPSRAEGAVNALHIVLLSGPVAPQVEFFTPDVLVGVAGIRPLSRGYEQFWEQSSTLARLQ